MPTDFPTRDEDIRALRGTLLRELAASTYPKEAIGLIARNRAMTVEDVRALVVDYGYPDKQEMRRQAFEQDGKAAVQSSPSRPAAIPHPSPDDRTEALLQDAEQSAKPRIRHLAGRARKLIAELTEAVKADQKERQLTEAAAKQRAELAAEVADLEAQLAKKKAQLKPVAAKKAAGPRRTDSKEIREWAAKHSVSCPDRGRLPNDVIEAYELAVKGAA